MSDNTTTNDDIQDVFDFWVTTSWTGRGIRPVLTDKRKRLIQRAVKDYGPENCKLAITGNSMSDWHQGKNPNNKKYNSIELILRDAEHIENFANMVTDNAKAEFLND